VPVEDARHWTDLKEDGAEREQGSASGHAPRPKEQQPQDPWAKLLSDLGEQPRKR
jgi:hypothetical protein